jgi:hypothetical protein
MPRSRTARTGHPAGAGVGGGIRTLGHWNHNPALYQLSYTHREGRFDFIKTAVRAAE